MGERLKGVKAVVTGGAGAIGLATARAFLREGGSVFVADLDRGAVDEAVASLASEAKAAGVVVAGGTADVRSPGEVRALMRAAASRLDGLNALINNAGTIVRNLLVDYSEADIDLMLDVNVKGVVLCSQAAVPLIRESGGGSITSTSSQAGRRGWEYSTVYGASKAAVVGLSRAMAVELAPGIRVNSICPGHVRDIGMAWRTFEERKSAYGDDGGVRGRLRPRADPLAASPDRGRHRGRLRLPHLRRGARDHRRLAQHRRRRLHGLTFGKDRLHYLKGGNRP